MASPLPIEDGLPEDGINWPHEIAAACAEFQCGDVVRDPPLFYFADTRYAIWAATHDYIDESGDIDPGPELIDAVEYAPLYGVITSQTCDIGEIGFSTKRRPWVMVAPVYDMQFLPPQTKGSLKKGKHSQFLIHLPELPANDGQFWVLDLRIEIPVEKSFLVGRSPIKSFRTDLEQRCIPDRVAQLRSRPAWAEPIIRLSVALTTFLKLTKTTDKALWDQVREEIDEIGARVDSVTNTTTAQLAAFSAEPASAAVRTWWEEFYTYANNELVGVIDLQLSVMMDLNTCSVAVYRQYQPIPFNGFM